MLSGFFLVITLTNGIIVAGGPTHRVHKISEPKSQELQSAFPDPSQQEASIKLGTQDVIRLPETIEELENINCERIRKIFQEQPVVEFQLPDSLENINDVIRNTPIIHQATLATGWPRSRKQMELHTDLYGYMKQLGRSFSACLLKYNLVTEKRQGKMFAVTYHRQFFYMPDMSALDIHTDNSELTFLVPDYQIGGLEFYPGFSNPNTDSQVLLNFFRNPKKDPVIPKLIKGRGYLFAGQQYPYQKKSNGKLNLNPLYHAVKDRRISKKQVRASFVIALRRQIISQPIAEQGGIQ